MRFSGNRESKKILIRRKILKKKSLWIAIFLGILLFSFSSNSLHNQPGLSLKETESNPELKYTPEQNYLFETIKQRRTVRKFASTPVPKEHILKILDAARFAPSAGNQQPWKFLVIEDRAKLDKLKEEACTWYLELYKSRQKPEQKGLDSMQEKIRSVLENVLSAQVYVAVLVDSHEKYPDYIIYDGSLAAGNLMIAARSLGYGTGFFTSFFPEEKIK
jgi:nitroreductase